MMNNSAKNQRISERFNIEMQVELVCPDGSVHVCTTRNISEGGAFVLIQNADVPIGEMVNIKKLDGQDVAITLKNNTAIVVHKECDGVGLAFVDLSLG